METDKEWVERVFGDGLRKCAEQQVEKSIKWLEENNRKERLKYMLEQQNEDEARVGEQQNSVE